ncbi:MAG: hypothetical protein E6L08_12470 [Verrucomicrobia bacterium]|nr:MAG: hypothetical protein E6L08_12470 [Verrucomicrobiota bacterium]
MDFETRSLDLLFDAHAELSASLNSLGGKQGSGYVDNFRFWSSVYMGHVSQGFIYLRRANGIAESRFLIRPAIELMLKQKAIEQRPDLIYRLGLTETRSDRTWLRALSRQVGETFDEAAYDAQLRKFKNDCAKLFPSGDFADARLTIEEPAKVIDGGEAYYNSHYRTYGKFTHATLRVIIGGLDEVTTDEDNPTMILCVLSAVESLASIGGSCPNLARLSARRDQLLKQKLTGC